MKGDAGDDQLKAHQHYDGNHAHDHGDGVVLDGKGGNVGDEDGDDQLRGLKLA